MVQPEPQVGTRFQTRIDAQDDIRNGLSTKEVLNELPKSLEKVMFGCQKQQEKRSFSRFDHDGSPFIGTVTPPKWVTAEKTVDDVSVSGVKFTHDFDGLFRNNHFSESCESLFLFRKSIYLYLKALILEDGSPRLSCVISPCEIGSRPDKTTQHNLIYQLEHQLRQLNNLALIKLYIPMIGLTLVFVLMELVALQRSEKTGEGEEEDDNGEIQLEKVVLEEEADGKCLALELNGYSKGSFSLKTIKLAGELNGILILILIVWIAGQCNNVSSYSCIVDALVYNLGSLDMILGIAWLGTLDDVLFNWQTRQVRF
ncbi:hypothetical protein Tco_1448900 [Tanacetum coccineum]